MDLLNHEKTISSQQRIVRTAELSKILSVSKSTIWRWRQSGAFPHPISMGPKLVGWTSTVIDSWINSKKGV